MTLSTRASSLLSCSSLAASPRGTSSAMTVDFPKRSSMAAVSRPYRVFGSMESLP